jgi:transcriptional regulator with XRE-family HTH domain
MRRRDQRIDIKIGSTIRMQRLKMEMSQSELGKALGVTFQQIQKYENGTNAVAATRIGDLCRVLKISPNDLIGVSAKLSNEAAQFILRTSKTALKLEKVSPNMHQAIDSLLDAVLGRLAPAEPST